MLGKQTPRVAETNHAALTVFGIGSELTDGEWRGVVRQVLAQRLLAVQGDYGTLALTGLSDEVLQRKRQVLLRREPPRVPRARSAAGSGAGSGAVNPAKAVATAELSASASGVFDRLRAWRAAEAKEQGVPAYVIFHDATLRQIAADAPSTLADLSRVSGVGEAKLARYGQQILDLLASGA